MKDKLEILTSDEGRRMLKMVSPIYEGSYVGLWMMEVIGRAYDGMREAVESMREQITPRTATWSLPYWEDEYGIAGDAKGTTQQRRLAVLSRIQSTGAFTPWKVRRMAEALTGVNARVVEDAAPNTFAVYLSAQTTREDRLRRELERVKPAHLSYQIRYEQAASGRMYFGCAIARGVTIEIRQAN